MKDVERTFEKQLRKQIEIDKMQIGFMPGKGTNNVIFLVKQMMEKYKAEER